MKIEFAREHVDMPQQNWVLPTAANPQICVRLKLRARPLHACIRRRYGFHVELQITQESRVAGRPSTTLTSADQRACSFQPAAHVHALYLHTSRDNAATGCACQPKIAGDLPAHAFRIPDPCAICARGNVKAYGTIGIIDATGESQHAASYLSGNVFEK